MGPTADNLKSAIEGETYEYTEMYPGFAKTARDEGFDEIARVARDARPRGEEPRRPLHPGPRGDQGAVGSDAPGFARRPRQAPGPAHLLRLTAMTDERASVQDAVFDYERWEARLPELREAYAGASPFPHVALDDFLSPEVVERAAAEFPPVDSERWIGYLHVNERKFGNTDLATWGPELSAIGRELNSRRFVAFLSSLTGIEGLIIDETFEGGGLHQSKRGGFLNVHADFTVHPHHRDWRRRINLLLYLNADWDDAYGGELELWSRDVRSCEQRIAPLINRAVIFNTDADAFHGHPEPLTCPPDRTRKSVALYYFTEDADARVRSTEYRARPGDGMRSAAIYADKMVLRGYDRVKRRLGLSDDTASRFLHRLERLRPRRKRDQG